MRLRSFLRLGALINALPFQILDGQVVDAVPVMADFNWIVSQVNGNVPPAIAAATGSGSGIVFVPAGSVGGTGDAITLAPSPAIVGYAAGQSFRFVASAKNTGGVTINTSGLGTRALTLANGNVLIGGELQIGGTYDVCDNGTNYVLVNFPAGSAILSYAPVLSFAGGTTGITYASQNGQVMTFGNLVLVWIFISLTSKGSSTGVAGVTLPVTCNASLFGGGTIPMGSLAMHQVTFSGIPSAAPQPGLASMNFPVSITASNLTFLNDTNFANNSRLSIFSIYAA